MTTSSTPNIELKQTEVARLQLHPHPVEFDMYYSC